MLGRSSPVPQSFDLTAPFCKSSLAQSTFDQTGHHQWADLQVAIPVFWPPAANTSNVDTYENQKCRTGLAVFTLVLSLHPKTPATKIWKNPQYPTNKINRTGVILRVFRTLTLIQIINSAQNYIAHSRHEVEIVWCETQMRWLSWWEAWKLVGCNGVQSGSCDRGVAPLVGPQECRGLKWMSVAEEGERRGRKVQTTKCSPTGGAEMFSEFIQ